MTSLSPADAKQLRLAFQRCREIEGTLNEQLRAYADASRRVLIPAVFVVGRDGIVKARFVDPDFRKLMEIDDLLEALEGASREN